MNRNYALYPLTVAECIALNRAPNNLETARNALRAALEAAIATDDTVGYNTVRDALTALDGGPESVDWWVENLARTQRYGADADLDSLRAMVSSIAHCETTTSLALLGIICVETFNLTHV